MRPSTENTGPAEHRTVTLRDLKPRPAKARMTRVGIVPEAKEIPYDGLVAEPLSAADSLQFPANGGVADTNVTYHGGSTAPGVPVQLIFWGDWWQSHGTLRSQLVNAAVTLVEGPYYARLQDYGVAGPTYRGDLTVISQNPPTTFDDGTIGDLVWNMIDQNFFPEPDDSGGANYYCVLMPAGTVYGPGGALAAHSWPGDYDFPFDWDTAWVSWVGNADLDTMTRAFGHELAETCTDPQGDGWKVDSSGAEIGDLCNQRQGWVKGVYVEGYWSNAAGACVIPQVPDPPVVGVSRSTDKLDVFTIGLDNGVYTAAWEPGFTNWHGWWSIQGGKVAPGTSVSAVSRSTDKLDVFVIGLDYRVWTAAWEPGFSSWHGWWPIGDMTCAPGTSVTVVSRGTDKMDIFAVRSDYAICTSSWSPTSGGWAPWTQIQHGVAAPGTTVYGVSRNTDLIDVFAVGTDHGTYTAAFSPGAGWQGWWNVKGGVVAPGTSITAVSRSTDKLDIFAVGTDHGVYTAAWQPGDPEWGGWWRVAGGVVAPGTSVFGVSRSTDKLDIFAVGTDHGTYTAAWQPGDSGWQGWWDVKGGIAAPGTSITAVSRSTDKLDIFVAGTDYGVYTAAWQPGDTQWGGWWNLAHGVVDKP